MGRGLLLATVVLLCTAPAGGTAIANAAGAPISTAALTPGDVNGAKVDEQGYVTDVAGVARYERDERQTLTGYGLGAVDYLYKPVAPEILRAKAQVFVQLQQRTTEVSRQAELLAESARQELRSRLTVEAAQGPATPALLDYPYRS